MDIDARMFHERICWKSDRRACFFMDLRTADLRLMFWQNAQLDHDGDGYITARDLKEALDGCDIHIEQSTMERLVEQQGYGGSKGLISAAAFQVSPLPASEASESFSGYPWAWFP